ncbi:MAG TPA: CHAT domain-containing protein [Oscillatoriaceae cyanobacterium M33_DOE_052]|nr:CHAT domain-containing protein [Oscillatoriaceae cyanobacterium M33_DOE_052]
MLSSVKGLILSPLSAVVGGLLLPLGLVELAQAQPQVVAQVIPAADGTGTVVEVQGNKYQITGGRTSGDGANLFHSLQEFGLTQGQIADFLATPNIRNILGRVSGGNASIIDGLIQVSGGNANLFLMNPAGIVFGPSASLNVLGSFTATTATGIGFDSGWFEAFGNNDYGALVGNPNAFIFSISQPGSIINWANLTVINGDLNLIGGTVVNSGSLMAPVGEIMVTAVPGSHLVRISQPGHLLSLEVESPSSGFSPVSLPQLLTGSKVNHATTATVTDAGEVILSGSGLSVSDGDVVVVSGSEPVIIEGKNVNLTAGHNLSLVSSDIRTAGDMQLNAAGGVTVRDGSFTAGGNLWIQGNGSIDILAIPGVNSYPFQSGGDITLVSDRNVYADSHFRARGSFSIQKLGGEAGTLISRYDPIISAEGNVIFGDYTGVSLKVEATGSINSGNIIITGPDTTLGSSSDPDAATLRNSPAVIIRAGVTNLGSTSNLPPDTAVSETSFAIVPGVFSPGEVSEAIIGTISTPGGPVILNSPGDMLVDDITSGGGEINLSAGGNISASSLNSSNSNGNGGAITINANGSITGDILNASSVAGIGGNITLNSPTDINVLSIDAQGGGQVNIAAGNFFRATGTFTDRNGISASIATTTNATTGGDINIRHGGSTTTPFIIGDASTNGTAGAITSGGETLAPSFQVPVPPSIFNRSNITIITDAVEAEPEPEPEATIPEEIIPEQPVIAEENIITPEQPVTAEENIITPEPVIAEENIITPEPVIAEENIITPEPVIAEENIIPEQVSIDPDAEVIENIESEAVDDLVLTIIEENTVLRDLQTSVNITEDINNQIFLASGDTHSNIKFTQMPDSSNELTIEPSIFANARRPSPEFLGFYSQNSGLQALLDSFSNQKSEFDGIFANYQGGDLLAFDTHLNEIFDLRFADVSVDSLLAQVKIFDLAGLSFGNNLAGDRASAAGTRGNGANPSGINAGGNGAVDITSSGRSTAITGANVGIINGGAAGTSRSNGANAARTNSGGATANSIGDAVDGGGGGDAATADNPGDNSSTSVNGDEPADNMAASDNIEERVWQIEESYGQEFAAYLGVKPNLDRQTVATSNLRNTLKSLNAQTSTHAAIIYMVVLPEGLEILIVTGEGVPIRTIIAAATGETLINLITQLRSEITNPRRRNSESYLPFAQELYKLMIAPIEAALKEQKIDTLLFSMDAGLRSLPIAALHDGEKFLAEKYSLGIIPSFAFIDASYRSLKDAKLLAMGASQFTNNPPLPAVPVELKTITSELGADKFYLNQEFTRANLSQSRAGNSAQILHIATHANFQPGGLVNSYIQLWNEQLTLDEIPDMGWGNPPLDLLVISACRSALGDREAELGLAGLAVKSGVRTAIASLWFVSDEGTLALMSEFYRQLKTAPTKAEALRRAQVAMIRGEITVENGTLRSANRGGAIQLPPELAGVTKENLGHPYYWSAFTVIGSPW